MKEIKQIKRIRGSYNNKNNNKKKKDKFKFCDFTEFYDWYVIQYNKQDGKCYYCDSDEKEIEFLFSKKYFISKRWKRGFHLEVERKDTIDNEYTKDNCVLACYFCNNDKSDILNEKDYFEYLENRKGFIHSKYISKKNK